MAIFPFFSKKKQPVLVRCTYCYDEFYLSPREVRLLETKNADDPVCPVKEECDMCHIGFVIPVNYTNNLGKTYLFHETKPKIKNLDPNTVMERIFGHGFYEFEIPEHLIRLPLAATFYIHVKCRLKTTPLPPLLRGILSSPPYERGIFEVPLSKWGFPQVP